jgi:hypothetical protein
LVLRRANACKTIDEDDDMKEWIGLLIAIGRIDTYESAYGFSVAEAILEAISACSNAHYVCHN